MDSDHVYFPLMPAKQCPHTLMCMTHKTNNALQELKHSGEKKNDKACLFHVIW